MTRPRIALVHSQWHFDIVEKAVTAFTDALDTDGRYAVDIVAVPGAFEIPLAVQRLARGAHHDAVATCGLVVDGGIYRHEFVAAAVVNALMRVQLDTDTPVFSGVLTPHHFHDSIDHTQFFASHLALKGRELATTVLDTLALSTGKPGR